MKGRRILSLITAFALALTTFLAGPGSVVTAYADNGDPAMQMGAAALSKGANETGAQILKYGGHDWFVIAYGDDNVTLLAKNNFGNTKFDPVTNTGVYSTSTLRTKVEEIAAGFSDGEKAAVASRTLAGGSANLLVDGYNRDNIKGDPVEGALLWPLSVAEADKVNDSLRQADPNHIELFSNHWWLRTPGNTDVDAAIVNAAGNVNHYGLNAGEHELGVRPAFYLNRSSVLFTSAAAGSKTSGETGADALSAVGTNTGNEWKATVKGLTTDFAVSYCVPSYNSETGAITVKYTGAAGNYISAIVTDSTGGTIKQYGRIAAVNGAEGEVTINTSGKMADGDKLYLFCEQYNGDNATDYASDLKEITIPPVHSWEWITDKEATCGAAGEKHQECSVCQAKQSVGTVIEPTGEHDWEWVVDMQPTCIEEGEMHEECSVCHEKRNEGIAIDPTGHDWKWVTDKKATCGEAGIQHEECSVCHEKRNEGIAIAPTGNHTWKDATCTEPKTCEVCGATEGEANGHDWEEIIVVQPTCVDEGEGYEECTVCHERQNEDMVIAAKGHDWEFKDFTWTGNETDGYTAVTANYVCKNDSSHTTTAAAQISEKVTDPTCTEGGKTTYTATIAADASPDKEEHTDSKDAKATEPTGHDWEFKDFAWTGNETDGYTAATANYVCKNDNSHTTTAEAQISEKVTDPICTEGGKTTYTATVAADASSDKTEHTASKDAKATEPTGHDWEFKDFAWTGNETDGYTAAEANYVCKTDNSHTETAEAQISEKVTDPTCTKGGKTTYTATVAADASLDKAEHTDSKDAKATETSDHDWEWITDVQPTCVDEGEAHEECTVCHETRSEATAIDPTGHDWKDATCTEPKTCKVCGATEGEAKGHDWNDPAYTWTKDNAGVTAERVCKTDSKHVESETVKTTEKITKEATYEAAGEKVFTAEFKNTAFKTQTKTVEIPKLEPKKIMPKVTLSATSYTYNGKVRKPTVTVKDGSTTLPASAYTVKYPSGGKNVGKYTVEVTLKGSYAGTGKATFRINPKGTTQLKPVSAKKAATVKWKKQTAKMSSSRVTGYQIQIATDKKFTKNKKTLTVKGYNKASKKVTGLKGGKKYYVRVRTYKTVKGVKYYSPWCKARTVTTKK